MLDRVSPSDLMDEGIKHDELLWSAGIGCDSMNTITGVIIDVMIWWLILTLSKVLATWSSCLLLLLAVLSILWRLLSILWSLLLLLLWLIMLLMGHVLLMHNVIRIGCILLI